MKVGSCQKRKSGQGQPDVSSGRLYQVSSKWRSCSLTTMPCLNLAIVELL